MDGTPRRMISDMRGVRYGEVLAVFARDSGLQAEVYGTQMLNDCPQELWASLAGLGGRLSLPDGWSFRTRILDTELVVDTSDHPATVVQDELENTYTLPV